ncbi:hypothetical protein GUY60_31690, partial [Streptomyces sp. YC537]|nr:hypothetical protein [Streptomyces boluensis]
GWGWNKVKGKHNITKYGAVEYTAKSPKREHVGGTSYRSTAYAGKYRCRDGVCTLVKQYKVWLTVNEKKLRDGHDRGVINMYCLTVAKCPAWVSTTLAKQNRRAAEVNGPAEADRIDRLHQRSYAPLADSLRRPVSSGSGSGTQIMSDEEFAALTPSGA